MISFSKIKSHFSNVPAPKLKKRPTIGSHCLTTDFDQASWVIIGVGDDRGVKNNYGRPGARKGPEAFRESFYAHSIAGVSPAPGSIFDLGNLKLHKSLKVTLDNLKLAVHEIKTYDYNKKILVIGGGHDIAYGEIGGCLQTSRSPREHHIINIDAHSDVRPLEKGGIITSGTPFYRLVDEDGFESQNYHPFGVQRTSNSRELVEWMTHQNIEPVWLETMPGVQAQTSAFRDLLQAMEGRPWHFSIDMDGFPSSESPGVSAPGVFGVHSEIFLILESLKRSLETLQSVGIYEIAPNYDEAEKTQKLAAKLAYLLLSYTS